MVKYKEPKVSIIMLDYNGREDTEKLLHSLKKITYKNYNIIVVDNGSKEKLENQLKKDFPKIHFIRFEKNTEGCKVLNFVIKESYKNNPKYVFFMNNDMTVDKDFLSELVDQMEAQPDVAVSGPKIYYMAEPTKIWSAGLKTTIMHQKQIGQNEYDGHKYDNMCYVDGLDGALLFRCSVLEKIGLFHDDFYGHYAVNEWCLRAKKANYKCLFVPKSRIWHAVGMCFKRNKIDVTALAEYYSTRNWLLMLKRNHEYFHFFVSFWVHVLILIYKIPKYLITKRCDLIKKKFNGLKDSLIM